MDGQPAFELACSGAPPSFLVDGATYEMRRPRASVAAHIRKRHDFMEILNFLDQALTRESAARFRERALHPRTGLEIEEITEVFTYVLGEISGMPYWTAELLVHTAAARWHVFEAHCGALDPLRLPFDRFLGQIYGWLIRDSDSEGIEKFEAIILKPPPEIAAKVIPTLPEWTKQAQGNTFAMLAGQRGIALRPAYETFGDPPIDSGETGREVVPGE